MLSERNRRHALGVAFEFSFRGCSIENAVEGIRAVVHQSALASIKGDLPPELHAALLQSFRAEPSLLAVGYWAPSEVAPFPDPHTLVDPEWCRPERESIIGYLKSGSAYESWRGYSSCRFRCGAEGPEMGSEDLTDGKWVWPAGLAHYISQHHVRLPDEFIANMAQNEWVVPAEASAMTRARLGIPDHDFWVTWYHVAEFLKKLG